MPRVGIALQETARELDRAPLAPLGDAATTQTPSRRGRSSTVLVVVAGIAGALAFALGVTAFAVSMRSDGSDDVSLTPAAGARVAIAIAAKPGVERIPFDGAAGRMELVVGPRGRAALVLDGLIPAPEGRSYQAWHVVGREPAPLGMFTGTEVAVPLTGLLPPGATVEVSLEPEGGAEAPTGRVLYTATRL